MEEQKVDISEFLSHTLEIQQNLQASLTNLEARSRRINMHIHGIPEGSEGDNMQSFVEKFYYIWTSSPWEQTWNSALLQIPQIQNTKGVKSNIYNSFFPGI